MLLEIQTTLWTEILGFWVYFERIFIFPNTYFIIFSPNANFFTLKINPWVLLSALGAFVFSVSLKVSIIYGKCCCTSCRLYSVFLNLLLFNAMRDKFWILLYYNAMLGKVLDTDWLGEVQVP